MRQMQVRLAAQLCVGASQSLTAEPVRRCLVSRVSRAPCAILSRVGAADDSQACRQFNLRPKTLHKTRPLCLREIRYKSRCPSRDTCQPDPISRLLDSRRAAHRMSLVKVRYALLFWHTNASISTAEHVVALAVKLNLLSA